MTRRARRWRRLLQVGCAALALGACAPVASVARDVAPPEPPARAQGEYLLTLRADADPTRVRDAFRDIGVIELRHLYGRHYLLRLRADPGLDSVRARSPSSVEAVQPNYEYRTQ